MKAKVLLLFIPLWLLSGCATNHNLYKNYCQKDYWGDTQFDIFGRKNCVGSLGHWVDSSNAQGGYYCTSPKCKARDTIVCTDNCDDH